MIISLCKSVSHKEVGAMYNMTPELIITIRYI